MNWFLKKYAPSFCWVTKEDLYLMAVAFYGENVDFTERTVVMAINRLVKEGVFITKKLEHEPVKDRRIKRLYLKKECYA